MKCLQTQGRQKVIDIGGGWQSSAEGLVGPGQDPGGGPGGETPEAPPISSF